MISMIPNIKTEEQKQRVKELIDNQSSRHDDIVRFVHENEEEIALAIKMAIKNGSISGEKDHFTENSDEATLEEAFRDRLKQWQIANHKLSYYVSTGTEDTMFKSQD